MKELNQQEIQTVSGAANINSGVIVSLLGAATGAGLGALVGGTSASVVGLVAGGIIGGIKGYSMANDSSVQLFGYTLGDNLHIHLPHIFHFE